MPIRAAGIDPGTMSMDLLGFVDDGRGIRVFLDEAIPRDVVTRNPGVVLEALRRAAEKVGGLDAVVAPSGYGLPLVRASEATDCDIREATFVTREDVERRLRIIGLREVMRLFRSSGLPAWFTPGVVHLPTVPPWRKANRIDMGTADKLFTVAAALANLLDEGVRPHDVSAIVVEVGYAYTAAIGVEGGAVVDGVGGTSGYTGYLGMGFMDAELAYALAAVEPRFSKTRLFEGGAAFIPRDHDPRDLEGFVERGLRGEPGYREALEALVEGVLKDIAVLLVSVEKPRWVFLSGRWVRIRAFRDYLEARISAMLSRLGIEARVRLVESPGRVAKQAAFGAAVIADGLAGGRYAEVVEALRIRESRGSIFDHILLPGVRDELLREFRGECTGAEEG